MSLILINVDNAVLFGENLFIQYISLNLRILKSWVSRFFIILACGEKQRLS